MREAQRKGNIETNVWVLPVFLSSFLHVERITLTLKASLESTIGFLGAQSHLDLKGTLTLFGISTINLLASAKELPTN